MGRLGYLGTVRFFLIFFTLALAAAPVLAGVDYKIDPTFSPSIGGGSVKTVFVQPNGKILVGGDFSRVGGVEEVYYLARLNADGTADLTFNSQLTFPTDSSRGVKHIKSLPNGQFLITGSFRIGSQYATYARMNSDGSIDATMATGINPGDVEPLPDGKFLVCGSRVIGGQTYEIVHRLNPDGSPDPGFRVTFGTGYCNEMKVSANGKILMTGFFGPKLKNIYRLNPDGSLDTSFDTDIPVDSGLSGLTEAPDGKIFVSKWPGDNMRLTQDGRLDAAIPLCQGAAFLPLPDGKVFVTKCRKWPGSFEYHLARLLPDGTVDQSLDYLDLAGSNVYGYRSTGNGGYYVFGDLRSNVGGIHHIARLVPDLAVKPKFDFDGDGRSDVGVFRPSDAVWYIIQSSGGESYTRWGLAGDKLAAHDFDEDGKTDVGLFRNGNWYGLSSVSGYRIDHMGEAGDKPLVGTFLEYGPFFHNAETWLVRGIRSGVPTWFIWSTTVAYGAITLPGEQPADRPIIGDFNGDSWDEIGYFRNGLWYIGFPEGSPLDRTLQLGTAGDVPVPADYDGDRQTDYAVYKPSKGTWTIKQSSDGTTISFRWGQPGDIAVPADYDGDGKTDIAIYRNGIWWQYLSATGSINIVYWGLGSDLPIAAQAQ